MVVLPAASSPTIRIPVRSVSRREAKVVALEAGACRVVMFRGHVVSSNPFKSDQHPCSRQLRLGLLLFVLDACSGDKTGAQCRKRRAGMDTKPAHRKKNRTTAVAALGLLRGVGWGVWCWNLDHFESVGYRDWITAEGKRKAKKEGILTHLPLTEEAGEQTRNGETHVG